MTLVVEQLLNGLQLGVMLFLLAAGLTLIFGVMGVINLAHGSLYMVGAYGAALTAAKTGSPVLALVAGVAAAAVAGMAVELAVMRRLYARDHLDQVLATFALILIFNQGATALFGRQPLFVATPAFLSGSVQLPPGFAYPVFRLAIIAVGLLVAIGLYLLINKTRVGMLVRAGSTDRETVSALGVDIERLFVLVFVFGALLAAFAGAMAGPLLSIEPTMGDNVLILAFVVIVIGGIGSIRGAFVAALLIGLVDTLGRAFATDVLKLVLSNATASAAGPAIASMLIYVLMALVLVARPAGLFGGNGSS